MIRQVLAWLCFAGALARMALDWQATMGQGEAWRFTTIGPFWEAHWNAGFATVAALVRWIGGAEVWGRIDGALDVLPVAALLLFLGAILRAISAGGGRRGSSRRR